MSGYKFIVGNEDGLQSATSSNDIEIYVGVDSSKTLMAYKADPEASKQQLQPTVPQNALVKMIKSTTPSLKSSNW